MTPAQHDPQNDLSRTLARQAERFTERGGSPVELENVLARAGEIRRGRRMRATMVMAAVVLAIAVPVGIQVVGDNDPTKKNDPSQVAIEPPNDNPLSIDGLKAGKAPADGYVLDGTLYSGKDPQPLGQGGEVRDLARVGDGYLIARQDTETGASTMYYQSDGNSASGSDWTYNGGGILVSEDGGTGVFVEEDGTVMAVESGADRFFEVGKLPTGGSYALVAFTGDNCSGRTEASDACDVYVADETEEGGVWAVRPNVDPEKVDGLQGLAAVSVTGDRAIQTSYNNDGTSCWTVTTASGDTRWDTCRYALEEFSPDGKYVIARPSDSDGIGAGRYTILGAGSGEEKIDLGLAADTFVYDAQWEDDTHVLATLVRGDTWAVVRVSLNGHREYAIGKTQGTGDFASPFDLG